jgi:superfamily II DNA or RNA helicase
MMELRPYQRDAVDGVFAAIDRYRSTILVMPTATGKTICFAAVADRFRPHGRVLVLAHREELIDQAVDKIQRSTSLRCGVEMGDRHVEQLFAPDVVVASVQTLARANRREMFAPDAFGLIIIDECFPAGTAVDGRAIETISVGDEIRSFNHEIGAIERRRVVRVFKSRPSTLVRIRLSDGRSLCCTPGHPVFTERGYVAAGLLVAGDEVRAIAEGDDDQSEDLRGMRNDVHAPILELDDDSDVLARVQEDARGSAKEEGHSSLRVVRRGGGLVGGQWPRHGEEESRVLLGDLQGKLDQQEQRADDGCYQSKVCIASDEGAESDGRLICAREDVKNASGDRSSPAPARRERTGDDGPTGVPTSSSSEGMGARSGGADSRATRVGISDELQARSWSLDTDDRDRDRRKQSLGSEEGDRRKEGRSLGIARVDRVEVHEPGSDGRFGGLCSDGFVYNVEVEHNHNYFVDGVLVHNCHHATSQSYRDIIDYFPAAKVLGVTATPDRSDGEAMGKVFESVAYVYEIRDAIEQGFIVPLRQKAVRVDGLDFSKVRTTAGDLNDGDLEKILLEEEALHGIAIPTVEQSDNRPTIVFTPTVAVAHALAEVINRYTAKTAGGMEAARALDGSADTKLRRDTLADYAAGRFRFLVNCSLFTEGFDAPLISCVAVARPTKSRALYAQMVGRGFRLSPETSKRDLLVLDFKGNAGRHALVNSLDILDGNSDAAVRARAEELVDADPAMTVLGALDLAAKQLAEEAQKRAIEENRRRQVQGRASYQAQEVDPFVSVETVLGVRPRAGRWGGAPATERQLEYLRSKGIELPDLDKGQASQLIDALQQRRDNGLCTYKQARLLLKNGVAPDLSFAEASAALDEIAKKQGWRNRGRAA